jgi:hypothetical protein
MTNIGWGELMKKHTFLKVRCVLLLAGALTMLSGMAQTQPTTPGPKPQLKPPPPKMACRVDPSVTGLLFAIVNRTSSTTGVVSITGVITNRGNRDFVSEIQQQSIQIFENGDVKLTKPFQYLQPNGQEFVVFQRSWDTSANAQGGKPPTYRVRIVYGDDVLTDANPNNNDCDLTNNLMSRSGDRITALF